MRGSVRVGACMSVRAGRGAAMRHAVVPVRPWLAAAAVIAQLAAVAVIASPAVTQELPAPPSLRVAVDTTTATVGARLHLTVAVEHPAAATVQWPDSLDLAPFEVVDAVVSPPAVADGRATTTAVLTLTAFELGELEIPSFVVGVASPAGVAELATDPFGIAVVSVGLDEGTDIRDIRGPLSIPRSWLVIGLWVLALALAAGGGYWLAHRARRRATDEGPVSEGPPRPAHEIAYEALGWLESSTLLRQGRIKEYYIEVSDIIRRYLEGRYGIRALEMTSREVLHQLEGAEVGPDIHWRFASFFEQCDLVKFAKYRPGPAACHEIVPAARALVDATPPPPEPEPEEGAEGEDGVAAEDGARQENGVTEEQGATRENGVAAEEGADQESAPAARSGPRDREGAQPQAAPVAGGEAG